VDPIAGKYPGWSPYNYTMNNPINLVDPDGKEVEEATKEDAKKVQADINKVFSGDKFSKLRALFTLDKKKFNKIDAGAVEKALDGVDLSDDEKSLINTVTSTINS
jgi:hypothetical protein